MVNTEIRLIIFFAAKDGEALYSQQKQGQELTGSDHELLNAKFRLKLKKVEKTTGQFRYDLSQILHDYTVEVRNRFKGLDLIDRVPDELWNTTRQINRNYTYIPFLPSLPPVPHPISPGHHRAAHWAPCATQQLLTSHPSYP